MKSWKNVKPHSQKSRTRVYQKYGKRCFLDPRRKKYPICNRYNGKEECKGHQAAQYYLNINIGKLKKKRDKSSTQKRDKYKRLRQKSLKRMKRVCSSNRSLN